MRLMVGTFRGADTVFAVSGGRAFDLTARWPVLASDLMPLIVGEIAMADVASVTTTDASIDLTAIIPRLPVARPGKIICLGLNYVDHIKEGGYAIPDYPALFMRGANSIMAAGSPMIRPACSDRLDYEAELMVVISTRGRHIAEADALDHVFGYTVFNDGSIRDYQRKTHQWTPGKNFDSTGAIGPIVVTPDELPPGAAGLRIQSRVGSEILQDATTADMMWSVAQAIAIISEYATLEPGDLIAMGTPPGVGHARTPPRFLGDGEVIEIEIEGIGICASPVVDEDAAHA